MSAGQGRVHLQIHGIAHRKPHLFEGLVRRQLLAVEEVVLLRLLVGFLLLHHFLEFAQHIGRCDANSQVCVVWQHDSEGQIAHTLDPVAGVARTTHHTLVVVTDAVAGLAVFDGHTVSNLAGPLHTDPSRATLGRVLTGRTLIGLAQLTVGAILIGHTVSDLASAAVADLTGWALTGGQTRNTVEVATDVSVGALAGRCAISSLTDALRADFSGSTLGVFGAG